MRQQNNRCFSKEKTQFNLVKNKIQVNNTPPADSTAPREPTVCPCLPINTPPTLEVAEEVNAPLKPPQMFSYMWIGLLTIITLVTVGLSFSLSWLVNGWMLTRDANNNFVTATASSPLRPVNISEVALESSKIVVGKPADYRQRALAVAGGQTPSAYWTFNNNDPVSLKTIDLYLDIGDQRSRDFFLMNQQTLKNLVEHNILTINIHPVPTGNMFNALASETITQTMVQSPEKAWGLISAMFQLGADSKNLESKEKILEALNNVLVAQKIDRVNTETILQGKFFLWLNEGAGDPKLIADSYPPLLYVDNNYVGRDKVNIFDSEALRKYLS